jgi:hypothetical protein
LKKKVTVSIQFHQISLITSHLKSLNIKWPRNMSTGLDVFPFISCECERCISTLLILKTYLRSTMVQSRLTSLGLMYIHRDLSDGEQTKDSWRFCKEATEKDYFSRHFNWIIKVATCMFVYYVTIFQIVISLHVVIGL